MGARRAAATVAALVGGTALTGCGLIGGLAGSDVDVTSLQLHPTGEMGLWLDAGYAGGLGETWSVPGIPCGAAEGVLAVDDPSGAVVGYRMSAGTEVWRVEGVGCSPIQVTGGDVYVDRATLEGTELVRIDIATGETQAFAQAPDTVLQLAAVGRGADAVVLHAEADAGPALLAFGLDGVLLWQLPIDTQHHCELLGGHVGCENIPDGTFTIVDVASGEPSVPATTLAPEEDLIWAVDGYTIVSSGVSMDAETSTVYDFDGTEIGIVEDAGLPSTPALTEGVAYSVEDLVTEGASLVRLTDADGRPVVHMDGGMRLTSSGVELGDDIVLMAAAADGSTVLARDHTGDVVTLTAADGSVLHTFESGTAALALVLDGVIVDSTYGGELSTVIYPPAG